MFNNKLPKPIDDSGVYALFLHLPAGKEVSVGRLGSKYFVPGLYIYCGSAQRNLAARIARHQKRDKLKRWHIDYLREHTTYLGELAFGLSKSGECFLTREFLKIPGSSFPVTGFGSSDCRCASHLVHIPVLEPKG